METNKTFKALDREDNEIEFIFRVPNADDMSDAEMYYASRIARLVRQKGDSKLLVRSEVDEFLKEQGIWSDKDQEKVETINKRIDEGLTRLKKGGIKLSEGREIAIKITEARQELVGIMQKRQIFDNATIESLADDEKIDYLIYACTLKSEDGDRYWESFEDMKDDKASDVYRVASQQGMSVLYGVDADFEKNLPENKWLKKYNFIDDDLTFIDRKTGEFVDKQGRPISEVQEDMLSRIESILGDISEETPFIDDYEVEEKKAPSTSKKKAKRTRKKKATAVAKD